MYYCDLLIAYDYYCYEAMCEGLVPVSFERWMINWEE